MCCKIDRELASIGDLSRSCHRFALGSRHQLLHMHTRFQNELSKLKKLFGLPPGETVLLQAELWNLSIDDVENLIDFESTAVDTNMQSEDEEDVEELSNIQSDSE